MTEQEQRDLFTPGYAEWCLKRWIAAKFAPDANAIMVARLADRIVAQPEPIRYPALRGVFVRGRSVA